MADIVTSTKEQIFQIKKWLGLNESPDGDTMLRMGEASVMRNFRITRENHLQIRAGYAMRHKLGNGPVRCLWSGYVKGESVFLAACGGHLWRVEGDSPVDCGAINDGHTFIFGFDKKAYLLAGGEYYAWDGESLGVVEGYIPLVAVAVPPAGGGTLLEPVNRLTSKRRRRFSPDGSAKVFQLGDKNLASVLKVERSDGGTLPSWTADLTAGTVTFSSVPTAGTDCITVTYDSGVEPQRERVTGMRFAELYGGSSDDRVFLYGDGSNQALYSDIDGEGRATAEYFPELNVLAAGSANTPITGMLRHFSKLLVFKLDGAYSVSASSLTLSSEATAAAFFLTPVQRDVGNAPMGQVRLVSNNPRSVWGGAVYDWKSPNNFASADERVVDRQSQRVETTLRGWDLEQCFTFDDDRSMEWYLFHGSEALVHNYQNDAWYYYNNLPALCMARHGGELYFGTAQGELMHFSRAYSNDNGAPLDAYWESGAMDFDMDWKRKYSADLWVSIEPERNARVLVELKSNRKSDYPGKLVSSGLASFGKVDFNHFSFGVNWEPQVRRVRIKVKKFTYATLMFSSLSSSATVTVLGVDFKIRYTGNVKQR